MNTSIPTRSRVPALTGLLVCLIGCPVIGARELVDALEDQEGSIGSDVTFSLEPKFGGMTFQWFRQLPDRYDLLSGQTNKAFTIQGAQLADVGFYLCQVTRGNKTEYTDPAALLLSTASDDSTSTGFFNSLSSGGFQTLDGGGGGGGFNLYAPVSQSGGSSGSCPGTYAGYVTYKKSLTQGWGYAPTAGTTVHTAEDVTRTDTKVEYLGKLGDGDCDQTIVTVPDPTASPKYRFTIYFPNNVPTTNAYPIFLTGFNP